MCPSGHYQLYTVTRLPEQDILLCEYDNLNMTHNRQVCHTLLPEDQKHRVH